MHAPPIVLSIAGYDPSSGAGVTADIKTAAALGCYAVTCITALTVQSTQGVFDLEPVKPELVRATLESLADDLEIAAVRIGMLGSGEVAATVAAFLDSRSLPNVVLDPVIRSSSGVTLVAEGGLQIIRKQLIPGSDVLTPNVDEAALLVGGEPVEDRSSWEATLPEIRGLAGRLHDLGAKAVVITGGHLDPANDYLSSTVAGHPQEVVITGEHIDSCCTHGTGCAFATALACRLAFGDEISRAVRAAKAYVRNAILSAYPLGKGTGPVNHFG